VSSTAPPAPAAASSRREREPAGSGLPGVPRTSPRAGWIEQDAEQLSPLWSAAKIAWLRDDDRDVFSRTRWFANGQEYFLYRMGAQSPVPRRWRSTA
jgi:hypothetical protein